MMAKLAIATALSAATLVMAAPATAATIINTGTPVGPTSWALSSTQNLAGLITITQPTNITAVRGYITEFGPPSAITISLFSGSSAPNSANLLFSATGPLSPSIGSGNTSWSGLNNLNWSVAAGNYWVSFATSGLYVMRGGAPLPLSNYAFNFGVNTAWIPQSGLHFGVQVDAGDLVAGGVPEPLTWTMLILGFGLVGGAMRRRAQVTTSVRFA